MASIDINSELCFHDGNYLVVGFHGSLLKLRHSGTGEYSTAHIADISSRLIEPPVRVEVQPRDLDNKSRKEQKELDWEALHLQEMEDGTRPDRPGKDIRPQYDPATTTLNQRIESKVSELRDLGKPASRATLLRKRKAYKSGGLAGLIDRRTVRKEGPLDRADKRVLDVLIAVIAAETYESTGTGRRLQQRFIDALLATHPGGNIQIPSEPTLYRYANFLTKGKYTTGSAKTRRTAANTPHRPFGTARRLRPGQETQIDSSPWDILVRDSLGNLVRVQLTILIDVATRSIIAVSLRPTATKGVDHAFLLAQALTPRKIRPGSEDLWKLTQRRMPWADLTPADERDRLDFSRPFIKPERIIMDNGADYRSLVFEAAARKHNIGLTYSAPHTPTDKPIVERNFRTIKDLFAQDLPGFKSGDVQSRGERLEKGALLDVVTLAERFEEWVIRVWQNRPHDALFDPMHPSIKMTPNEMYNASFDLAAQLPLPIDALDYIELMPIEHRTIQKAGVQINLNYYDSIELQPFRDMPSNDKANNNHWEVRYNPLSPETIWVRHPDGHFMECKWRTATTFRQPFADEILQAAVELASQRTGADKQLLRQVDKDIKKRTAATALTIETVQERKRVALRMAALEGTPFPTSTMTVEDIEAAHPEPSVDYLDEDDDDDGTTTITLANLNNLESVK